MSKKEVKTLTYLAKTGVIIRNVSYALIVVGLITFMLLTLQFNIKDEALFSFIPVIVGLCGLSYVDTLFTCLNRYVKQRNCEIENKKRW